jgi:hypothetical protein
VINAKSFEDLKKIGKSKSSGLKKKHHEEIEEANESDEDEDHGDTDDFIDEDKSKYASNKHHIHKELTRTHKNKGGKHVIKYQKPDEDAEEELEA